MRLFDEFAGAKLERQSGLPESALANGGYGADSGPS
jgi:hypothetical protein